MPEAQKRKPGLRLDPNAGDAGELREQLEAERRISELSRRLLSLDPDHFEDGITDTLAAAAKESGADRAQLSWVHPSGGVDRYTWAAPGIEPIRVQDDDYGRYRWITSRLLKGQVVNLPRVEELPDDAAAERESLLDYDNRSYLGIPILGEDRFVGCLDVRCVRGNRVWSRREIERLQLIGQVFLSVLRRREAQAARREAAERFDALSEKLEVALCESGDDGRIVYASPQLYQLLGYGEDELIGVAVSELIHPADRDAHRRPDAQDTQPDSGILRLRHRSGEWRSVDVLGRNYETRAGDRRYVTLLRDVSEQLARNAELEARLQLEALISDLSRRFLSAETEDIDGVIDTGLAAIAKIGSADRSFLLSLPELRRNRPYFFEWRAESGAAASMTPTDAEAERYRGFSAKLLEGEIIRIPAVAALGDEFATEREAMLASGIRSYLLVPVLSRGSLIGVLGLHCVEQARDWSEHEVTLMRLVAELFTSALRRKRNATRLLESEARFRALAENSQDSICELSTKGRILYASPAFAELVGEACDALEGRDLYELAHPEDRELVGELIEAALCGVMGTPVVFRLGSPDGGESHIEITARGFASPGGEARLVAVLRDVTTRERDRRKLEQQIAGEQQIAELSRHFLDLEPRRTADAIQDKLALAAALAGAERSWIFSFDPRGEATQRSCTWSRAGVPDAAPQPSDGAGFPWALSGFRRGQELQLASLSELPPEATDERADLQARGVRSFLGIPLLSGRHLLGLMGFETLRGERVWSPETVTLLRLVGEIFVSALRREQAEVELERSQIQLLQSQKMEAVGTLAGGIAHDFNNHLAVMLGNARFVAGALPVEDAELRDALADLQRSAEHCAQLTRSLLAFSRRSPVAIQNVEVGTVLAAVGDLVKPLLPSSIDFRIRSDAPGDYVEADPTQLRQVLINLVVNARDAMPEGGGLMLSSSRRELNTRDAWSLGLPQAGLYAELSVRDQGEGMNAETRARIFEPFFTTKKLGEGTGLGLATAYGIVQQCGGAIAVESEIGRGTLFRVLLPVSRAAREVLEPPAAREAAPGSETLLLVEDEPAVRRLLARTLRGHGYRVFEAEDGVAGLALAENEGPAIDLVVTDVVMPRMGGIALASKLQTLRPGLQVLFLSGHPGQSESTPESAVPNGRFLQKPFDDETLLATLREMLDTA